MTSPDPASAPWRPPTLDWAPDLQDRRSSRPETSGEGRPSASRADPRRTVARRIRRLFLGDERRPASVRLLILGTWSVIIGAWVGAVVTSALVPVAPAGLEDTLWLAVARLWFGAICLPFTLGALVYGFVRTGGLMPAVLLTVFLTAGAALHLVGALMAFTAADGAFVLGVAAVFVALLVLLWNRHTTEWAAAVRVPREPPELTVLDG